MPNKEHIDRFTEYFDQQIKEVSSVKNNLYRKVLFACLLDTLGIARFPKHHSGGRMISFLLNCSSRSDLNRVSLVQLSLFLNYVLSDPEKLSSKLYNNALNKISEMKEGSLYNGNQIDPYYNQLDKNIMPTEKKILKLARYVNLFYAYRNEMVHGFKEPGYGMEMRDEGDDPFYHSYMDKPWQLVFPSGFFKVLCLEALEGLKQYLEKNDVDPYKSYEFGDMWVKKKTLDDLLSLELNRKK